MAIIRPSACSSRPSRRKPDIGLPAAIAAAQKRAGTDEPPTALDLPARGDAKAAYGVWFADGYDPWNHSDYSGDLGVNVDRTNADRTIFMWGGDVSRAETLWEDWNFPMHTGWAVNPWWRSIWLVLGLDAAPARLHGALDLALQASAAQAPPAGGRGRRRHVSPALLGITAAYLALVGALAVLAAAGVRCRPAVQTGIVVAELALLVQAAIDIVKLARGHRPAEPAVHLGYVLVSIAILPLLIGRLGRPRTRRRGRPHGVPRGRARVRGRRRRRHAHARDLGLSACAS